MLPKPAYCTREWPVEKARSTVRALLTESINGIYTSISILKNGEWEHVPDSAVLHTKLFDAEDRVEMLIQGGALSMVTLPEVSEVEDVPRAEVRNPLLR
jgi:hypothetical protein